jgi:pimeloyl-ACP methyl ester carboxylesterase
MADPISVLYCPGLDGNARELEPVVELLPPHITIEPFYYPTLYKLSFEDLANLISIRLAERPKGRRLLAGCSFGGAVAQKVVMLKPDCVDALLLVATFNHEAEAFASMLGRAAVKVLPDFVLKPVTRVLARWKLAGGLDKESNERFLKSFSSVDPRLLAARLELLKDFDVRPWLSELRLPVDVIYSNEDPISGAALQLEGWKRIPNARVNGVKGGHVVQRQAPEAVRDLVVSWVDRVTGQA